MITKEFSLLLQLLMLLKISIMINLRFSCLYPTQTMDQIAILIRMKLFLELSS